MILTLLVPVVMGDAIAQEMIPCEDDFTEHIGPVGIVSELYKAHSDVTGVMIDNSLMVQTVGYVNEEVYLEGTWVDETLFLNYPI